MIIQFERSGGFTGLNLHLEIDTRQLPEREAQEFNRLVESAGFFGLPERLHAPEGGADRFRYQLTIADGPRRHTVRVGESGAPPALQDLLQQLTLQARLKR